MILDHDTAANILRQIAGEATARADYESLIADSVLTLADEAIIQEIQADETNHMLKLMAMVKKYDGGIKPSPDGVEEALVDIAQGFNVTNPITTGVVNKFKDCNQ